MTPRQRRLTSDLRQMEELAEKGEVEFRTEGTPPETYQLMLTEPGVAIRDGEMISRETHRCDIYLHRDYPRRPPVVVWATPVFHPNLLGPDRNGGVCIGSWSASESLADLVRRLADLASWRSVNPEDPLDLEAAKWTKTHGIPAGSDITTLIEVWNRDPGKKTKAEN